MSQKSSFNIATILLSSILLLSACDLATGSVHNTLPSNKGPMPTIVLANTSPTNIDMGLLVKITQDFGTKTPVLSLLATFYYQQNNVIIFKRNEKFICDGIAFPMDSGSFVSITNIPVEGTAMNCTYTSPQGQVSFSFAIPEQPKIISPINNAVVTRSAQTPMIVSIVPTCKDLGTEIDYKNTHGSYSGVGVPSPDGCVAQQTVNTLGASAGPGGLGVNETEKITDATINPGFHSYEMTITTSMLISVTWQ